MLNPEHGTKAAMMDRALRLSREARYRDRLHSRLA